MIAMPPDTDKRPVVMDADQYATEVTIAYEQMRRPPFYHPEKQPADTRLEQARTLVLAGRVQGSSDGELWQVHGREKTYYLRGKEPCTCPQGQRGKTTHCYHWVAVQLYKNVQLRLGGMAQPTLALGPSTPEERLAQVPTLEPDGWPKEDPAPDGVFPEPVAPGMPCCAVCKSGPTAHYALVTLVCGHVLCEFCAKDGCPACAEEAPAMETDNAEISHEDASNLLSTSQGTHEGVVVAPETRQAAKTPTIVAPVSAPSTQALVPVQPHLPTSTAQALEASLQEWSQQRAVVRRFIRQEMQEGVDFYTLKIGGRETKPTLSKAGAEKFLALFQLHAVFAQDVATWEMLGKPTDMLCYQCTLLTRTGEVIGEGHGVRQLGGKDRDVNMSVKMGIKSSLLDAVLRVGSLSEVFTQDLEEIADPAPTQDRAPAPTTPLPQKRRIVALLQQLGVKATTQQEYAGAVQEYAGWPLTEANYGKIIAALEAKLAQSAA